MKTTTKALLVTLLLAGLAGKASVLYYLPYDTDNIIHAIYFDDIVNNGNYFLKNWYISRSNHFFTDFPVHLLIGAVAGLDLTTIKLGAAVVFLALSGLLFLLVRKAYGRRAALFALVLFAALPLNIARVYLLPNYHIGTLMFALLSAVVSAKAMEQKGWKGFYGLLALISAITVTSVFSSIIFVAAFVLPVLFSLALIYVLKKNAASPGRLAAMAACLAAATGGGLAAQNLTEAFGLHMALTAPFEFHASAADAGPSAYASLKNLVALHLPDFPSKSTWGGGLPGYANVLLLLLGCASAVVFSCRITKDDGGTKAFITLYFMGIFVVLGSANLLYKFSHPWYLTPLSLPIVYFTAVFLDRPFFRRRFAVNFVFVVFLLSSLVASYDAMAFRGKQNGVGLAKFLEKEKLTYGYAHLESSNLLTFLSRQKVKVRPVRFERYMIEPYVWWVNMDWYDHRRHTGGTFLIVEDGQKRDGFSHLTPQTISAMFGAPRRTLRFENQTIYVWDYNIIQQYWVNLEYSGMK